MHIATVIGPGIEDARAEAMLSVMRTFVEWHNKDIQHKMDVPNFSTYYRSEFSDAFRLWKLHVWRLDGEPATWREQLEAKYDEQPVFAVVSGLVDGSWKPVDGFCNGNEIPCLFPNTILPDTENTRYGYSVHFSRGLELEGEALATHLSRREKAPTAVHQVRAAGAEGRVPAEAFRDTMAKVLPDTNLTTAVADGAAALRDKLAEAADRSAEVLAVWPGDHAQAAVEALNANPPAAKTVALPSTALDAAKAKLSKDLRAKVRLTHPYEKPTGYHPRTFRLRARLNTRGVDITHERLQLQTYYAMSQFMFGVDHLVTDFYRDYLLEYVEQKAESELNPGTHPELSLGPGVRFASSGAYIVQVDPEAKDGYKAVSDWIVP